MSDLIFRSFPNDTCSVSVTNDGRTGRHSRTGPAPEPDSGAAAVTLIANKTSGIAPFGIIFGATATGFAVDSQYHDLQYRWTFGDPGSTFSRLASNMPWGTDANIAYGPWAAHTFFPAKAVFAAAGTDTVTFTVTCDVSDGKTTVRETIDVTITDPDAAFSGDKTLIVDPTGDFSSGLALFAGARTFTTLSAALNAANWGQNQRFMILRNGATHPVTGGFSGDNVQIGSYGSGAYPVLTGGMKITNQLSRDCAIFGLEFEGGYDPTVPSPKTDVDAIYIQGKTASGKHTTIHDVGVRGHKLSFTFEGQRMNNVISDCEAHDWYDFGVFQGNAGWMGIVGTTLQQNPMARNGPGKYTSDYPNHGPIRLSRVMYGAPVIMNNCDLASFNDWSLSKSKYSVQPCLRLNNGGDPDMPQLCITQIRACGSQLSLPATNSYSASWPVKAVLDKIYHINWGQGGRHLGASFGGVQFKNIVTIEPDTDWANGGLFNNGPGGYENVGNYTATYPLYLGYPDGAGNILYRQEFLGITVVKLVSGGKIDIAANPITFFDMDPNSLYPAEPRSRNPDSVVAGGVLIHAPAWGLTEDVETGDALTSYPVLPRGTLREQEALNTAYAVPLSALASYRPRTAKPADPGEKLPVDDFFGKIRPANPSKGAIEP